MELRLAHRLCHLWRHGLKFRAEPWQALAGHILRHSLEHEPRLFGRYRKAQPRVRRCWRNDRSVHAYDVVFQVEPRAARVDVIDRGIGLDVLVNWRVANVTVER